MWWHCRCGSCSATMEYIIGRRAKCRIYGDWIIWLRPVGEWVRIGTMEPTISEGRLNDEGTVWWRPL